MSAGLFIPFEQAHITFSMFVIIELQRLDAMTTIATVDIATLITSSPDIRGGKPRIAGTGVTVHRIVGWYKLGLSPEEIADCFEHITLAQVYAALAFYHANQALIDEQMAAEEAEADVLEQMHLTQGGNADENSSLL